MLVIHSQPKSKRDFELLTSSNTAISFLDKNDFSPKLQSLLPSKTIYLNESDIYIERERSKDIWNMKTTNEMVCRENLIFTNAGASRSEFSKAIQAFHVWHILEAKLGKEIPNLKVITENKDLINLIHFHNKLFLRVYISLLLAFINSVITSIYHLTIDLLYFFSLKIKKEVMPDENTSFITFSLLKHWSVDGDWRYGGHFCKNYKDVYAISCMRAGGLQNYRYSSWTKLVKVCLNNKNTILIEKMVRWSEFFNCLFCTIWLQLKLMSRTLFSILLSKSFSHIDLLILFEENRHFSELFSNKLIHIGATNLYKNILPSKIITYHFEFSAGRSFISASKKSGVKKVLGLQHGLISKGKWCYELTGLMSNNKNLSHYTPDLYLLEGVFSWWVLSKTIEPKKIMMVGATRHDSISFDHSGAKISNLISSFDNKYFSSSCSMVLLMDLHTSDQKLYEYVKSISNSIENLKQIYLRPHPRDFLVDSKIKKLTEYFPSVSFKCLRGSLYSDLKSLNGLIVWGESSGAMLECMGHGFNVKQLRPKSAMIIDPFIDITIEQENINNFIMNQKLINYPPISMLNSIEFFRLLCCESTKSSSALILDALYK